MNTETVTIASPEMFAASIPALVGFYPANSLVVTYLNGKQVIVTMRVDLDASDEFRTTIGAYVAATGQKVEADRAIVAVFTSHEGMPYEEHVASIENAMEAAGLDLQEAMLIDDGYLYPYLSGGIPDGVPIPESSALAAERVAHGDPPLAESREEIIARFTPRPELAPSKDVMLNALEINRIEPSRRAKQAWEALKTLVQNRTNPGVEYDPLRATLILAVKHVNVRDYVMCQMSKSDSHVELTDMLVTVALTAPEGDRKQICGMAAAMMTTLPSSVGAEALITLAEDEGILSIVELARSSPVPPELIREGFLSAEEATNERLVEQDKLFHIEQKRDPFERQLRRKRS